jgi:threonine dehydrogenase-like Zn-dependent dehydrogenase
VLSLALGGTGSSIEAAALNPGPTDIKSIRLRAGPDSSQLLGMTWTVFGLGASGGHVAVALAESGIGRLILVDAEQLLPENAVRHVAGRVAVGIPKAAAMGAIISDHAPWTKAVEVTAYVTKPSEFAKLIAEADVVTDTTGGDAATHAICISALAQSKKVVSGALYRGGSIARVRRQGLRHDLPILERTEATGYLAIPRLWATT